MSDTVDFIISSMWLIFFVIVMLGVFVNIRLVNKYINLLQSSHPVCWEQIHDSGVMAGEMKTQLKFLKFIFRRDYQSLDNENVINEGRKLRSFFIIHFSLCACFFTLTAVLLA